MRIVRLVPGLLLALAAQAFGPGSNGIEARDAEGRTLKRVQFCEAIRMKTTAT